jgi:leader peptidase (prepilin peptidase) / N-methyltransferase
MAEASEWLLTPWTLGILGLLIGSFLNVVIYRRPVLLERQWLGEVAASLQDGTLARRVLGPASPHHDDLSALGQKVHADIAALPPFSLSRPRSRCPSCGKPIVWYENIPVLSWLWLKGRCAACRTSISARYPFVELLTGALFTAVALQFGPTSTSVVYCVAIAVLIAAALIDFDTTWLTDEFTLPLVGLGLLSAAFGWTPVSVQESALGAVFGYLSLWSVATLYRLVRGHEGMAEGDFRLLAGLGALLGWKALLPIILLSSAVGAAIGIFMILFKGHRREVPIPFGPYLAGGGIAAMFWGATLSRLWLKG